MLKYTAITQKGIGKERNEDRIMVAGNYLAEGELQGVTGNSLLAVVCDGVGGEAYGDQAAEIASMSFLPLCNTKMDVFSIKSSIIHVNRRMIITQKKDVFHQNMSTTVAGLYVDADRYIAFNLGDTRIYKLAESDVSQLSIDHTAAQSLVEQGQIRAVEVAPARLQSTITRYIGGHMDSIIVAVKKGEITEDCTSFLLCSDGLYKTLGKRNIARLFEQNGKVSDLKQCRAIFNQAVKNGSEDDISIVLVRVESYDY